MSRVWILLGTVLATAACIGPRSAIVLPECVERIEVQGQFHREGERKIILDHTLDLPLTRTEVTHVHYEGGKKRVEQLDITSSQPDLAHLFVGGGLSAVGLLLGGLAAGEVLVTQRSVFEAQPFYAALFGASFVLVGGAVLVTGWHPPSDTILKSTCVERGQPEPDSYER